MKLTDNELSIMNTLWESKKSLTSSQIIDACVNKHWKVNSIHILINSMLEKGAIAVDGVEKTGKTYSRTFAPTCTHDEYMVSSIMQNHPLSDAIIRKTTAAFLDTSCISDETLNYLEHLIQERKRIRRQKEGQRK